MKAFPYLWHMAWRRKAACLLVVISTMAATVFMLFYPSLIDNTRKRLEETYSGITVTGSILSEDKIAPAVSGNMWKKMQQSGYFRPLYGSASFVIRTFPKDILKKAPGKEHRSSRNSSHSRTCSPALKRRIAAAFPAR